MRLQRVNEFCKIISSIDGVRPATAMGTAVTPTQNTTGGTYATLLSGASLTEDAYGILININSIGISAAARDCLATLGLDPAGGTSFTDLVSLLCGSASPFTVLGGHFFYFPLWIKAGTTIGMRASVNSATLTDINAFVKLYCKPSRPESIWCGQKIESLGVTAASSTGTAVTPGTVVEGTATEIGTTTRDHRFFEFGYGINDANQSTNNLSVDILAGTITNQKVIGLEHLVMTNATEVTGKHAAPMWANTKTGDKIYARLQVGPAAADVNSIAVYCMGD